MSDPFVVIMNNKISFNLTIITGTIDPFGGVSPSSGEGGPIFIPPGYFSNYVPI